MFWLHHTPCETLDPRPGLKPRSWAVKVWSSNHWITTEFPKRDYSFFQILFIFGGAGSLLLIGPFSSYGGWELLFSCGTWVSHCGGFSCCGAYTLGHSSSSSCVSWAELLRGMWDLSRSGIKPVSPTLAGRYFTLSHQGAQKDYS